MNNVGKEDYYGSQDNAIVWDDISTSVINPSKGYLCYKTITSQNVLSEAQVKNFFIL